MPKAKPQIKTFQPPAQGAHWFQVQFGMVPALLNSPLNIIGGIEKRRLSLTSHEAAYIFSMRIFALSARDAHYQLSIQMSALGWTEGQNWRVTMICPEAEK